MDARLANIVEAIVQQVTTNQNGPAADEVEIDYRAGVMSVLAIARKHDIPVTTLRRRANAHGWIRRSRDKALRVSAAVAGEAVSTAVTTAVDLLIDREAARDIDDMALALVIARQALRRLHALGATAATVKEVSTVIASVGGAVEVIRRIRGLDAPSPDERQVPDIGLQELKAAFQLRLKQMNGAN